MMITQVALAIRHLRKHKFYTFINIFGLATGIAACLLLFRLVYFEMRFDMFHKNADRIARIITEERDPSGGLNLTSGSALPAQDMIQNTVSHFEQFARVRSNGMQVTAGQGTPLERKLNAEETAVYAESSFFRIFDWKWLAGNPDEVLKTPGTVVLARNIADKLYGSWANAVGKTLLLDNKTPLIVQGVVENAPPNSDFQIEVFVSYETFKADKSLFGYNPNWGSSSSNDHVYVLLKNKLDFGAAEALLARVGQEEYRNTNSKKIHKLQPLSDLHFNSDLDTISDHTINKSRLFILSLIGLLVLAMACFNFINLATAMVVNRSKEVGVRKSLGGQRGHLIRQFMSETVVIVTFAAITGALFAYLLSPLLKKISAVPDDLPFLSNPAVWVFLLVVIVLVSVLSGLYPAFVMARFDPVAALKNNLNTRSIGGISLRKLLVLAQFTIAQALIISTLVALSQMNFLRNLELGYQPELVYNVWVSPDSAYIGKYETFKQRLKQLPGVESVSFSSDVPGSFNTWSGNFAFGLGSDDAPFGTSFKFIDEDYFETYGLKLVAGRELTQSDTVREAVVNETLLKRLGINNPQEAIGKEMRIGRDNWIPVVGVAADFKTSSAHEETQPMSMFSRKSTYFVTGIRMDPPSMTKTVENIKTVFEETFPDQVFDGQYYDEYIAEFYEDENRFSSFCQGFSLLAILISCLGLLGLASLMATQKTKEIGVRKVLGASVAGITGLLVKDFLKLVLVAIVIASPLAYLFMEDWLSDFVYRTPIHWWVFLLAGLLSAGVALLTVGFQSVRAAIADPVKSLRSE
ncbi:MAG: ABC transporter permease [Saprospiraceae bacterium]|nr:ABC transporter permease [Saprospiraceae bacterium]